MACLRYLCSLSYRFSLINQSIHLLISIRNNGLKNSDIILFENHPNTSESLQ